MTAAQKADMFKKIAAKAFKEENCPGFAYIGFIEDAVKGIIKAGVKLADGPKQVRHLVTEYDGKDYLLFALDGEEPNSLYWSILHIWPEQSKYGPRALAKGKWVGFHKWMLKPKQEEVVAHDAIGSSQVP